MWNTPAVSGSPGFFVLGESWCSTDTALTFAAENLTFHFNGRELITPLIL